MPLEFEESANTETSYISVVPLPNLETCSAEERRFAVAWRDKQFATCLELLPQLPENITTITLNALIAIALRVPKWRERRFRQVFELRRMAVRRLAESPALTRLSQLKTLLFDRDEVIQEAALKMFRDAGSAASPMLREGMEEILANTPSNLSAYRRGVLGVTRLMSEWKDPECVPLLGDILLGKFYNPSIQGKPEKALKYGAISAGALSNGAMWYSAMSAYGAGEEYMSLGDFALAMLLSFAGAWVFAGLLYLLGFAFLLPYFLVRDNRREALIRKEAVQAFLSIGDRLALKSLMRYELNKGAKPETRAAILELLPLATEGDGKWMGRTARTWLNENLRETSPWETLKALRAVQIFGKESQISAVERLSKRGRSLEVREAAGKVLAVLESRRNREQEKRELLRASEEPDNYRETLLRPLQDRYDPQEAQELLHPSDKPEE